MGLEERDVPALLQDPYRLPGPVGAPLPLNPTAPTRTLGTPFTSTSPSLRSSFAGSHAAARRRYERKPPPTIQQ